MCPSASRVLILFVILEAAQLRADEPRSDVVPIPTDATVEKLAARCKPSVVVISVKGRDGRREGMGTGFVIGEGLIATNQHVIGEGRALTVETADKKRLDVLAVHALDRQQDLAILWVAQRDLPVLPLGDPGKLRDGQPVVALGDPQGLRHSVVAGVVSGRREMDGRTMIQLAIPIEPGNSGGPVLDLQGRVHGLMTIKSLLTPNLGFAVPVDLLGPLLKKPNSIPYKAWLTIGVLDPDDWQIVGSANWRQRAGHLIGEGTGGGLGSRGLCLARREPPAVPFEVEVSVHLNDETGAAGLVWHSDGADKHYGFYPSNGQLRFTRFNGPDVFSWNVLEQKASPAYRPLDWNLLRVRVENDMARCYVNGQLAFEVRDSTFGSGQVGLAKFRDTVAEFRQFRVARELPPMAPPPELTRRIDKAVRELRSHSAPEIDVTARLAPDSAAALPVLHERARDLELQAARLRQLAQGVHESSVIAELQRVLQGKEDKIDLLHAALLLARLDNDEVDIDAYRAEVDRMARKVADKLPREADDQARLAALNHYLFQERGFHGSRGDYYNRSNSYLSEVLDDREGIPITLSVLYIELARRLGVRVVGVGLPGHFLVRHEPARGAGQLIDVYEGGVALSREEAAKKLHDTTGETLTDEFLAAVDKRSILMRILHNLRRVAQAQYDSPAVLRYLNAIVAIKPDVASERGMRAVTRYQLGDRAGALKDVDWLLDKQPEGVDLERLREFRKELERP